MKKLRTVLSSLFVVLTMFSFVAAPVSAQNGGGYEWKGRCIGGTLPDGSAAEVATIQGLECLIANILAVSITMIGLGGFCMFIYGSFRWMLSGGNPQAVSSARNAMTYAVVGIVIALSAYILMNIISAFTGINVAKFVIPGSGTTY